MFSVSTLILVQVTMKGVMSHMKVVFFMHVISSQDFERATEDAIAVVQVR